MSKAEGNRRLPEHNLNLPAYPPYPWGSGRLNGPRVVLQRPSPGDRPPGHVQGLGDLPPAPAGGAERGHDLEVPIRARAAHGLPAAGAARGLHPGQAGAHPVADQLSLELPEAGDEVNQEPVRGVLRSMDSRRLMTKQPDAARSSRSGLTGFSAQSPAG